MVKRKPDPYELQRQRRADCYRTSAPIAERFPSVQSLMITATFKEPDWGQDPPPRVLDYNDGSKAHFEIECPHRECLDGGFDLSSLVNDMIQKHQSKAVGKVVCQGWQDRERMNKHRCFSELSYSIEVLYRSAL